MISKRGRPQSWAYLLVAGGLFLLAGNLGLLGWVGDWLWAPLFLVAAGAFLLWRRGTRPTPSEAGRDVTTRNGTFERTPNRAWRKGRGRTGRG